MNSRKILIVDDNREVIRMLAEDLRFGDSSLNIFNAKNGLDGCASSTKRVA